MSKCVYHPLFLRHWSNKPSVMEVLTQKPVWKCCSSLWFFGAITWEISICFELYSEVFSRGIKQKACGLDTAHGSLSTGPCDNWAPPVLQQYCFCWGSGREKTEGGLTWQGILWGREKQEGWERKTLLKCWESQLVSKAPFQPSTEVSLGRPPLSCRAVKWYNAAERATCRIIGLSQFDFIFSTTSKTSA